jgi:hypothetical protein
MLRTPRRPPDELLVLPSHLEINREKLRPVKGLLWIGEQRAAEVVLRTASPQDIEEISRHNPYRTVTPNEGNTADLRARYVKGKVLAVFDGSSSRIFHPEGLMQPAAWSSQRGHAIRCWACIPSSRGLVISYLDPFPPEGDHACSNATYRQLFQNELNA